MKINGVELKDLDILDLETAEKIEKINAEIRKVDEKTKGVSLVESIKIQCNFVFKVFNELFGEGTDKLVFGDRTNLEVCTKALMELFLELEQNKQKSMESIEKYSTSRLTR